MQTVRTRSGTSYVFLTWVLKEHKAKHSLAEVDRDAASHRAHEGPGGAEPAREGLLRRAPVRRVPRARVWRSAPKRLPLLFCKPVRPHVRNRHARAESACVRIRSQSKRYLGFRSLSSFHAHLRAGVGIFKTSSTAGNDQYT